MTTFKGMGLNSSFQQMTLWYISWALDYKMNIYVDQKIVEKCVKSQLIYFNLSLDNDLLWLKIYFYVCPASIWVQIALCISVCGYIGVFLVDLLVYFQFLSITAKEPIFGSFSRHKSVRKVNVKLSNIRNYLLKSLWQVDCMAKFWNVF